MCGQRALVGLVVGAGRELVRQVVQQAVVFGRGERCVERQVRLRDRECALDFVVGDIQLVGESLRRSARDPAPARAQTNACRCDAARPRGSAVRVRLRLCSASACRIALADPPDRVGDELDAFGLIEFVRGANPGYGDRQSPSTPLVPTRFCVEVARRYQNQGSPWAI